MVFLTHFSKMKQGVTLIISVMIVLVALHPLARATLTFYRQLHYLILIQFYQNYTHIVGKMLEMWMLYSHLQFEFYERRGRHRTHFAFFQNFMWWGTTCRHPNFASQFWYEKTLKFIWILQSVYAEYTVDWHRGLAISFWNAVRLKSPIKRVHVFYGACKQKIRKNKKSEK